MIQNLQQKEALLILARNKASIELQYSTSPEFNPRVALIKFFTAHDVQFIQLTCTEVPRQYLLFSHGHAVI